MALLATTDHPFEAFQDRALSAETDGMEARVVASLTVGSHRRDSRSVRGGFATPANERGGVRATIGRRPGGPSRASTSSRPAGLEIRTLVLADELDASCTPEIMAAIAERIAGALYEELPGTPHMQTLERPEPVAQALDRFLPTQR